MPLDRSFLENLQKKFDKIKIPKGPSSDVRDNQLLDLSSFLERQREQIVLNTLDITHQTVIIVSCIHLRPI